LLQKKQELETFENIELHFRQAEKFDEWWQAVCLAAEELDFTKSSLPLTKRDGTQRILVWEKDSGNISTDEMLRMIVPVHDRRTDSSLNIEIQVYANGSIESAGRRLMLFGRLIEEYSVANLSNGPDKVSSYSSQNDPRGK